MCKLFNNGDIELSDCYGILRNLDGSTVNLAYWDMRQIEFLTLSRMSLKLHTYEALQPLRDVNRC